MCHSLICRGLFKGPLQRRELHAYFTHSKTEFFEGKGLVKKFGGGGGGGGGPEHGEK